MRFLACLVLALASSASRAEEPSVAELVAGLRSDDTARRDASEAELARRFDDIQEELTKAAGEEKDVEAKGRLEGILKRGGPTAWCGTIEEGLARAKKYSRPLLVVRGDGARDKAETFEGQACRDAIDSEPARAALRGYVAVWVAEKGLPGTPVTKEAPPFLPEGHGALEFYVVHPRLGICHYLRGAWAPARLAGELERARDFAAARDLLELRAARAKVVEELKTAFASTGCAEARRHLHPWQCNGEGCVLRRLALCYEQAGDMLGTSLARGLPGRIEGGLDAKFPF